MAFYEISSVELKNRIEELSELNSRFRTEKDALSQSEQTLKSMWEGEANESFHQEFMKDSGQMDAFHTTIEQYIGALTQIAQRYDEVERRNQEIASSRTY